jgi:hypothetical protein
LDPTILGLTILWSKRSIVVLKKVDGSNSKSSFNIRIRTHFIWTVYCTGVSMKSLGVSAGFQVSSTESGVISSYSGIVGNRFGGPKGKYKEVKKMLKAYA